MVLSYHNIAAEAGHYTVSLDDFRSQLDWLQANYEIVSLEGYLDFLLKNGRNHPKQAVLTFDDAFQSFAGLVMPELERRRLPVALFVPTGYLGRSDEWNPEAVRAPVMDADTLKRISNSPLLTVGSHTVSHPMLTGLGLEDLRRELRDSKTCLEQLTGKPVDYLAYPFGQPYIDFNAKVEAAAQEAGYKAALGTSFSVFNEAGDRYRLARITVESYHGLEGFRKAIRPFNLRSLKQRVKNAVGRLRY